MASDFQAFVEPRGPAVVVGLSGELDIASVETFKEACSQALASAGQAAPKLVIDMRELAFIDSTGLRAFVEVNQAADAAGVELVLIRGGEAVMKVFQVTRLDERFRIVDDPDAIEGARGTS